MERLGHQDSKNIAFSGKALRGFIFTFYMIATTVSQALALTDLNLNAIDYELQCKGTTVQVGKLSALLLENGYYDAGYQLPITVRVANTGAIKEIVNISGNIEFDPIAGNLDPVLKITTNSCFQAHADTAASYLYVGMKSSVKPSTWVEKIMCYEIQAGDESFNRVLGDGITDITFINLDKTLLTTAQQVITGCNITGTDYVKNLSYDGLLAERYGEFDGQTEADLRAQSFHLFRGHKHGVINGVSINLTMTGANVNATKCKVVVRQLVHL